MTEPLIRTGLGLYVLDENGIPQPEDDVVAWSCWRQSHSRHVGDDVEGDVRVSTVFTGYDHRFRFFGDGPPILWETMIFGGRYDGWRDRYSSRSEAEAGHARAVAMVSDIS